MSVRANARRTACLQRRSLHCRGERTPWLCPAIDGRGRSTFGRVSLSTRRLGAAPLEECSVIASARPDSEESAGRRTRRVQSVLPTSLALQYVPSRRCPHPQRRVHGSVVGKQRHQQAPASSRPELHAGTRGGSAALGASSGPALRLARLPRSVAALGRLAVAGARSSAHRNAAAGSPSRAPRAAPRRGSVAQSVALPGRAKEKGPAGGCSEIAPTIPWELNRSIAKRQGMTSACKARCISIKNARI